MFPAVKRFGEAVKASLNLEMQVSKLECFSPEYNLSHCPWREALGAPVGMVLEWCRRRMAGRARTEA